MAKKPNPGGNKLRKKTITDTGLVQLGKLKNRPKIPISKRTAEEILSSKRTRREVAQNFRVSEDVIEKAAQMVLGIRKKGDWS